LFGINGSYKKVEDQYEYGARVRISHISAHFVDGHYDASIGAWRDVLNPRVYSREFIELMPFVKFNSLRVYTGITYLFHVTPDYLGKDIYQLGFDYVGNQFDSETLSPFLAYDFKIAKTTKSAARGETAYASEFGTVYASEYEITPNQVLEDNKVYSIQIAEGPIAARDYSWAYQVKAPFQVLGSLPRDKATGVPLNAGIDRKSVV